MGDKGWEKVKDGWEDERMGGKMKGWAGRQKDGREDGRMGRKMKGWEAKA